MKENSHNNHINENVIKNNNNFNQATLIDLSVPQKIFNDLNEKFESNSTIVNALKKWLTINEVSAKYLFDSTREAKNYLFLSFLYLNGIGCILDKQKAFNYTKYSADNGDVVAQTRLSVYYFNGIGVESDFKVSFRWALKASEKNFPPAQHLLASIYKSGVGCDEVNFPKAIELLKRSADAGYSSAQFDLAECYKRGSGIVADSKVAYSWYAKAAENGHAKAAFCCGICCKRSFGTERDLDKAIYWFMIASKLGDVRSMNCLAKLIFLHTSNKRLAIHWFRKSAELGSLNSQWQLSKCYQYGIGIQQDIHQSLFWSRVAEKNHGALALVRLHKTFSHTHLII
ncbi:14229_t:CDS:1 [Ambispora leptoticha]|uniref:14229_t:CDS:1 n=1 Tax=Ambispora leptoticha TaxID=144679 RepID=A0A9N9DEG9_9GLOM|nr:14229_t:CDS:1 [Ambispora leptoticha]